MYLVLREPIRLKYRGFDSEQMQPRYNIGQQVLIRRDDPSPFAGLPAVIHDVQSNNRGVAVLDRYVVVFSRERSTPFMSLNCKLGVI